jgi:sarcosine oxidase delta subunit
MLMIQCPYCHTVYDQDQAIVHKVNTRRPKSRQWPPVQQDQEDITTTVVDSYPELNN